MKIKLLNPAHRKRAKRYVQAALNIQTIMIILTKNTWFHWVFWRVKRQVFFPTPWPQNDNWLLDIPFDNNTSTSGRLDAIQVANICKRLYRLNNDFFEILIFRAWERKIRWEKTQMTNQQQFKADNLSADKWVMKKFSYSMLSDK